MQLSSLKGTSLEDDVKYFQMKPFSFCWLSIVVAECVNISIHYCIVYIYIHACLQCHMILQQ